MYVFTYKLDTLTRFKIANQELIFRVYFLLNYNSVEHIHACLLHD